MTSDFEHPEQYPQGRDQGRTSCCPLLIFIPLLLLLILTNHHLFSFASPKAALSSGCIVLSIISKARLS